MRLSRFVRSGQERRGDNLEGNSKMQTESNTPDRTPQQLELPGIEFAPPKVRRHGLRDAHTYPLVSHGKRRGGTWTSWRVPASDAWRFPEIELRAGNSWPALILDLDGANALERLVYAADRGDVLQPNWIVTRRRGGGTHAVWNLRVPVHRGPGTKARPMKALARIAEYYADTLNADRGYRAVLTHNPMAAAHGPRLVTTWGRLDPYRLGELGEVLPFGWRRPAVPATTIGRNCALFDALMRWAGSPSNAAFEVLPAAIASNQRFAVPLPADEVRGIAKSVERYRTRWKARGQFYTPDQRTLWGQTRGVRSGQARRKRTADRDAAILEAIQSGRSLRDVGAEFGLTAEGVRWIVRRLSSELHR